MFNLQYIRPEKTMFLMQLVLQFDIVAVVNSVIKAQLYSPEHHSLRVESFQRGAKDNRRMLT